MRLGHDGETFILGLWPPGGALLFESWENDGEEKGDRYILSESVFEAVCVTHTEEQGQRETDGLLSLRNAKDWKHRGLHGGGVRRRRSPSEGP